MADIFGTSTKVVFSTKHHGDVTLSKGKWQTICEAPERWFYPFNIDKIATTLINPDEVRHHATEKNQFFYYKKFPSIRLSDTNEFRPTDGMWFAIVVDAQTSRICTVFPVRKPKTGKAFKPN